MRIVMFYHSLVSDWNHGNAHFLRGIVRELKNRGADVRVYEPHNAWSVEHLRADAGQQALAEFYTAYPELDSTAYSPDELDVDAVLDCADLVLVHEWNPPDLVARIGRHRARHRHYRLFFHDTHHRIVTDPQNMALFDLHSYDGVLAYGASLRDAYVKRGLAQHIWVWHEAADITTFYPRPAGGPHQDLVWIGNWGDEERTTELHTFLLEPVRNLRLSTTVYGVRYPPEATQCLTEAGITYGGWLPNYRVPQVFARHTVTVHIPRRPYAELLPGIPTIRPFEALACGIPLVCSPWQDTEGLFTPGKDYLIAHNTQEMEQHLRALLHDVSMREEFRRHGLDTITRRHTCGHRVNELLAIYQHSLGNSPVPSGMVSV